MREVILASASPRRQKILRDAGISFNVRTSDINEEFENNLSPQELAKELSKRKAEKIFKAYPRSIVIGADTVVALEGKSFGKPLSKDDSFRMLKKLSGKTHQVFTAYTILDGNKSFTEIEKTEVTFRVVSDREIQDYVDTGDPMDKAGAYGIQSGAGNLIDHIDGDYSNVVGLPSSIFKALEEFGVKKVI